MTYAQRYAIIMLKIHIIMVEAHRITAPCQDRRGRLRQEREDTLPKALRRGDGTYWAER